VMNLHKSFLVLFLFFLDPANLFCQANRIDIGIEGGPGVIFLRNICEDPNTGMGFSAGTFFQYNFPKIFSVRADLTFERKGQRYSRTLGNSSSTFREVVTHDNYDYLVFQAFGQLFLGKKPRFFFQCGPYAAYLLKSFTVDKSSREADNRTYTRDQFFKKFDWGFSTGLGIKVPLWQNFLVSCEARYNLGMFQIVKDDISRERNWSEKTNSVNFLIGVTYRLCQRKSKE